MTQVIFKKFPEEDIIALFPKMREGHNLIGSYMHIGQHSGASKDLLNDLEDASPAEYTDLKRELINQIGYTLEVVIPPNKIGLGHKQKNALNFIHKVDDWHSYAENYETQQLMDSLVKRGLIETNQYHMFKAIN